MRLIGVQTDQECNLNSIEIQCSSQQQRVTIIAVLSNRLCCNDACLVRCQTLAYHSVTKGVY